MKLLKYTVSLILVLSVLFMTGCAGIGFSKDNELKIGVTDMTGNFNPFYAETKADREISSQVYRTVQRRGTDNKLINSCGGISYEYEGNKVKYTVSIRNDLFFSNGKNVTIDDVIFFYYFISDASYDGVYSDFYLNDIVGLKEFYFDDKNYSASVNEIEGKVTSLYSPASISADDLKKYLISSELGGKFSEKIAPDGSEWSAYFAKYSLTDKFKAIDSKDKTKLLSLAAESEAINNQFSYNAEEWYREKLYSEYLDKNYKNGINVTDISGIKKVNDYTCTILFNSPDINAVSKVNAVIVSKDFYSVDYMKGLADKVREKSEAAPGCGPYVIEKVTKNKVTLSENKYYIDNPEFNMLQFENFENGENDLYKAAASGSIDVAAVYADSERINALAEKNVKYFITNDDCYYSAFFSTKLDIIQRKALMGILDVNKIVEQKYGSSFNVPLSPLSIRFSEYPSGITKQYYDENSYAEYRISGSQKLTALNACYCDGEDGLGKYILEEYKKILAEKGITLNISAASEENLPALVSSGKIHMWITKVYDGPTCDKYEYFNSSGKYNYNKFSSPDIDSLTLKIHGSVGLSDRKTMTEQLLDAVMNQAIEKPCCQLQLITIYNTDRIDPQSFVEDFNYDGYAYALTELKCN